MIEFLSEFAYIHPKKHCFKHCIRISAKEHSTGPRVKVYYRNCRQSNTNNISISISNNPEIVAGNFKDFTSKEIKFIKNVVRINKDELLQYWYKPASIDTEDLIVQLRYTMIKLDNNCRKPLPEVDKEFANRVERFIETNI